MNRVVYKCEQGVMIFLILYVYDIILIGNDVGALYTIKLWLTNYFDMTDLGKASYILEVIVLQYHQNKILGLSQDVYIDKILIKFAMHNSMKES